jgi:D-inositol-3-phosphate glycosyltransferase
MNVYVRETSRLLAGLGVHVDVFTRSQNSAVPRVVPLAPGARVFHVPAGPEIPYDKYRLVDHLSQFVHGVLASATGRYDLIHSHYWISGMAALELRERWRIPVLHMYHTLGVIKNRVARSRQEEEQGLRLHWEWEVARKADMLVASHPLERAQLIWHYDAPPDRVRVIPCGVDVTLFHPVDREIARRTLGLDGRPWLLFVGRLEPIKGLDTLLRALALLRGAGTGGDPPSLLIVGGEKRNGSLPVTERELRAQIAALGLAPRISLVGAKPQVTLPLFYASAEACVLPSRHESFGMVALEAMACGTPVVASRVGGLSYTVRDGETGFLVPEGDAEALAQRVGLIVADPSLRATLSRGAVRRAQRFRWDSVVDALWGLYAMLAGGRRCRQGFRPTGEGSLAERAADV